MIIEFLNSIPYVQAQHEVFMPHIHCLAMIEWLAKSHISNDLFTVAQYAVIAVFIFAASKWGVKGGQWRKTMNALGMVFIMCSLNYLFQALVIYVPVYYTQLGIKTVGNLFFAKAVYHILMVDRNSLKALAMSVKNVVQKEGF